MPAYFIGTTIIHDAKTRAGWARRLLQNWFAERRKW